MDAHAHTLLHTLTHSYILIPPPMHAYTQIFLFHFIANKPLSFDEVVIVLYVM